MKIKKLIFSAFLFTLLVPFIGYLSFGIWPAMLFLTGYLGGFIFWLIFPIRASYDSIKWIYLITFALFLLHRVEEKYMGFFAKLSELTGVPVPDIVSVPIVLLLLLSVVAWIVGPLLYRKKSEFGYFLVWTFFASMGITEMAHFILPFFGPDPYTYFPGMFSVIVLAPMAWYGMSRLIKP